MAETIALRNWQVKWRLGEFNAKDKLTQLKAGWFDWFCKETSLASKTKKMASILTQIKDDGKIDLNTMYIWFKNGCVLNGSFYDVLYFGSICDYEVQFKIQIDCCLNDTKYIVYGKNEKPLFKCSITKELVNWLNTPWE